MGKARVYPGSTIRRFREQRGLTQTALATQIGSSQQQVQRWEGGQGMPLDIAIRTAQVLGVPVDVLFPKLPAVLQKIQAGTSDYVELDQALGEAGIDPDTRTWSLELTLQSGLAQPFRITYFDVDPSDAERLSTALMQGADPNADDMNYRFVLFAAQVGRAQREVAVACEQIITGTLAWEGRGESPGAPLSTEFEWGFVSDRLSAHSDPSSGATLGRPDASRDTPAPAPEEELDDESEMMVRIWLRSLSTPLEIILEDEEEVRGWAFELDAGIHPGNGFMAVTDVDGDVHFFRVGDILVLDMPERLGWLDETEIDEPAPNSPAASRRPRKKPATRRKRRR